MATIQELRALALQIRDADEPAENTALKVGQFLYDLLGYLDTKADLTMKGQWSKQLSFNQAPIVALQSIEAIPDSQGQNNKMWWSSDDGQLKWKANDEVYPLGNPTYILYYRSNKIYRWGGQSVGFLDMSHSVINDLTTGGEDAALSAEMGITLRAAIETLLSNLGDYAFPNGKPNISWVGTSFTITQNLTRVASDYDYGTIYSGSQLTIHLSADAGCTLSAVTVKMRGVDVTNDYYDATTGTIDIPSVTGDIVITAIAAYPFDAEIEFLQSSGTQWLDTGVVAGVGFRYEIKADVPAADTGWHRLLGARDADSKFALPVAIGPTSVDGKPYAQFGLASSNYFVKGASPVAGLHTFITQLSSDTLSFSIDGSASIAQDNVNADVLPALSLYMFSNHREDTTVESISAKVYYCKIWNGETLLRDFIPVRVGQVGQMFDRVSGQLFTNIGTGTFTLGNDITE